MEKLNEKALARYEAIAQLLNANTEAGERRRLRAQIMEDTGKSERTLRRYIERYKKQGLPGLANAPRSDKGVAKAISTEVITEAMKLREELPERSVRQIIEILEGERYVKPGSIARTTLNAKLLEQGMGAKRMKALKALRPARRFARKSRNSLWQLDVKYGPPAGKADKKTKTYMLVIIDDATRMIMHAEFYANQQLPILEDAFRKALLKYGKPNEVLVDNGKIFVSKWFRRACAQLGIRHIAAKPYSPETKGKCEKFNQAVDGFLRELSLEGNNAPSLKELNDKFTAWLEEGYIHKPHSALTPERMDPFTNEVVKGESLSPKQAYARDPAKIRYATGVECREAFLWEETRRVDKTGCVKIRGREYDVGAKMAGIYVDVRYDPFDLSVVEAWHNGKFVRKANPLTVGEWTASNKAQQPRTPKATRSRLLKLYEAMYHERDNARNGALIFYEKSSKGDTADVD